MIQSKRIEIKLSKKAFLVIMVAFNVRDETSLNDTALARPSLYVWIHKWEFILGQRSNAIIRRSILPRPKQVRFQAVAVDTWNRSLILNNNLFIRNDYYKLTYFHKSSLCINPSLLKFSKLVLSINSFV